MAWEGANQSPLPQDWHSFPKALQSGCVASLLWPVPHSITEMPGGQAPQLPAA